MPETLQPQTRKFFTIFLYPVLSSRKLLKCHLTAQKRGQYFFVPKQVQYLRKYSKGSQYTYLLKAAASVLFVLLLFYTCFTVTTKRFLRGSNFVTAQHGRDCVQSSIFFYIQRRDKKLYRVNICLTTSFVCRSSNVILQLSVKICKKVRSRSSLLCKKIAS